MMFFFYFHPAELSFESDESTTPLESALIVLELMSKENLVSQQDFQKVNTSLREMVSVGGEK